MKGSMVALPERIGAERSGEHHQEAGYFTRDAAMRTSRRLAPGVRPTAAELAGPRYLRHQPRGAALIERPLPQNLDAERAILGSILVNNGLLPVASERVRSGDFSHIGHQAIFRTMLSMHNAGTPIDLVTLSDALHRDGKLESAGGAAEISELVKYGVPNRAFVERYAVIVRKNATLRRWAHTGEGIKNMVLDGEDLDAILECAKQTIAATEGVDEKRNSIAFYTPAELTALVADAIDYIVYPFAARGMIALLDGAAKAAGKTTLILTALAASRRHEIFLNHATQQVPVLYLTEENPRTFRLALERAGLGGDDLHILPFSSFAGVP